jgi:peptide/nickel transport system substrate-binding protein
MTARDVVFSYGRLGYLNDNPAFLMGATSVGKKVQIDQVRALNVYTVQFRLPAPDASFLSAISDVNFGVLDARVVIQHGGDDSPDAATKDRATSYLNSQSAGTGPFVMTSWTRGASGQIIMRRNRFYWGRKPYLNEIVLQGVTSSAVERLEVSRGTVDIASNIDIDGANAAQHDSNVRVITGKTLDFIYMGMTTKSSVSKPLASIKVRRAVRYALDYGGIVNGLLRGVGTQLNGMIPVGLLGNDQTFNNNTRPRQNLAKARTLLRRAGYPHGFDVALYYPGGTTYEGVSFDLIAPKVQHDLAQVGINVKLEPEQYSVFLSSYRARKLPFVLFEWGVDYPDPNDFAAPFGTGGLESERLGYNWDSHLARLAQLADSTSNAIKRVAYYHQIQRIWLAEGPWIGIVQPDRIVVLHKGITGFIYSPVLPGDFRYVRKGQFIG